MASIAMGKRDGVARKASLTVVKADRYSTQLKRDSSAEIWIDGLAQVYDDVINKKAKSKAVVNMSIGTTGNKDKNYEACYAAAFTKLINALEEQDVPVAASVGNQGTEITNNPALLAKATKDEKSGLVSPPQCPALIVVGGAVVNSGDFYNDIRDERSRSMVQRMTIATAPRPTLAWSARVAMAKAIILERLGPLMVSHTFDSSRKYWLTLYLISNRTCLRPTRSFHESGQYGCCIATKSVQRRYTTNQERPQNHQQRRGWHQLRHGWRRV